MQPEQVADGVTVYRANAIEALRAMPDNSVHCCVTSPPYFGLRSYLPIGHPDKSHEVGLEQTPDEYVERLVEMFREVRRALRDDGTLWLNLGDSYAGSWGNYGGGEPRTRDATRDHVRVVRPAAGIRWTRPVATADHQPTRPEE